MTHLSTLEIIVYLIVSFGTATVSGIAGGGAGFINAPLLIFFGLSPAQAVATGKLTGLSVAVSSLNSMRGVRKKSKKELIAIMTLALFIGLVAPEIITNLDSELYRRLMGVILLGMIPVLIIKKVGRTEQEPSLKKEIFGYILLSITLFLQAIFGAGMGTLVNVVLMACLGMSALEANVTKRYSQVILNIVIVFGVLASSIIVWQIALLGIVSGAAGGYIGGKMAIKKGNTFILSIFIVLMFFSGIWLLV